MGRMTKPPGSRKTKPTKPRNSPGPKPGTLKIEGKWEDAVKKSILKKKPDAGWPKKTENHSH
jgi:hypothetical protein